MGGETKGTAMSDKQVVSVIALVVAILVAGALYLNLTGWNDPPSTKSGEIAIAKLDCITDSRDYDECADRVDRQFRAGPYEPWYKQQPVLAALAAGGAVFFVLAGGARLFLE